MLGKTQCKGAYNDITLKFRDLRKHSHLNKSLNDSDGALTDKSKQIK